MPLDVHSLNGLKSSGPMPSFDLRSVSKSFVHPECITGGFPSIADTVRRGESMNICLDKRFLIKFDPNLQIAAP